jgi:hypothetical protein
MSLHPFAKELGTNVNQCMLINMEKYYESSAVLYRDGCRFDLVSVYGVPCSLSHASGRSTQTNDCYSSGCASNVARVRRILLSHFHNCPTNDHDIVGFLSSFLLLGAVVCHAVFFFL